MKLSGQLPKNDETYGMWLSEEPYSDVHVIVSKAYGAVIGHNFSLKDNIEFSDIAVVLNDNSVVVQYADENKEVVQVEVCQEETKKAILEFLEKMKAIALASGD